MKNIDRIGALELHLPDPRSSRPQLLEKMLAPALRSLRITVDTYEHQLPCQEWRTPLLESLEIHGQLTDAVRQSFRRTLKSLSLCSTTIASSHARQRFPPNLTFLDSLSGLDSLQSLHLDLTSYNGDDPASVILPSTLTSLTVVGHTIQCAIVASTYNVRGMHRLHLDGTKNLHERNLKHNALRRTDIARMLSTIAAQSTRSSEHTASLHTLCLAVRDGSAVFTLQGWEHAQSISAIVEQDASPPISITLPCRESQSHVTALLSRFDISCAQILRLGPMELLGGLSYATSVGDWMRLCHAMQHVHTLVASELNVWLLLALVMPQPAGDAVYFPCLTALVLSGVRFTQQKDCNSPRSASGEATPDDTHISLAEMDGLPVDLWRSLAVRAAAGHPIERIVLLKASNLSKGDVESLREVSSNVEWDGLERQYVHPRELFCSYFQASASLAYYRVIVDRDRKLTRELLVVKIHHNAKVFITAIYLCNIYDPNILYYCAIHRLPVS